MEGGREESWLEGREGSLEGWLDQSESVVFEAELCIGPGGEGERGGRGRGRGGGGALLCTWLTPFPVKDYSLYGVWEDGGVHFEERMVYQRGHISWDLTIHIRYAHNIHWVRGQYMNYCVQSYGGVWERGNGTSSDSCRQLLTLSADWAVTGRK